MELILAVKSLNDMIGSRTGVTAITYISILILFYLIFKAKLVIELPDILIILLFILFSISYLKNRDSLSTAYYEKIISNFLMYFLGKYCLMHKRFKLLSLSYMIVLIVNLLLLLSGIGYIYWGEAKTFIGTYYFKTDFALAMYQCFIFLRLYLYQKKLPYEIVSIISIFIIIPILVFISNSRAYLFIYMMSIIVFFIEVLQSHNYLRKNVSKAIKLLAPLYVMAIVGTIYFLLIKQSNLLADNHLLFFKFSNDYNILGYNLQGRNVVWHLLLVKFFNNSMINRITGIDLSSALVLVNKEYFDTHNIYLRILYSSGYIGLVLFILFIFIMIKRIYRYDGDIKIKYTCIYLTMCYILSGISADNLIYTQQSWFFFFFMGLIMNRTNKSIIKAEETKYGKEDLYSQ